MNNATVEYVDAPHGSSFGTEKRNRRRTRAQVSASRRHHPDNLTSIAVQDFNEAEAERERQALLDRIEGVRDTAAELPLLSLMVAIAGYLNWYLISGHPVELSRHTTERVRGRTMTAVVMAHAGG